MGQQGFSHGNRFSDCVVADSIVLLIQTTTTTTTTYTKYNGWKIGRMSHPGSLTFNVPHLIFNGERATLCYLPGGYHFGDLWLVAFRLSHAWAKKILFTHARATHFCSATPASVFLAYWHTPCVGTDDFLAVQLPHLFWSGHRVVWLCDCVGT